MIIDHPLLGPRDAAEFVYLGDASLIDRPDWQDENAAEKFHDYLYLRDNPAGEHQELWYHEQGDRSWLVVTRDTLTHDILKVELARDVSREGTRTRAADRRGRTEAGFLLPQPMTTVDQDACRQGCWCGKSISHDPE